jgi:hypothetical protein
MRQVTALLALGQQVEQVQLIAEVGVEAVLVDQLVLVEQVDRAL